MRAGMAAGRVAFGLWCSVALLGAMIAIVSACDARRSDEELRSLAAPAFEEGSGAGDPYAGFPEPLRRAVSQTHSLDLGDRLEGATSLRRLADMRSLPRLLELLGDDSAAIRCLAAETLGHLGPPAREAAEVLIGHIRQDDSAAVRQCALLALARLGGDRALSFLLEHLEQASGFAVEEAIDALGRLGRIEAVPAVVAYLESPEASVVAAAARAVERIGPGGAELVQTLLESDSADARCAAATILARWENLEHEQQLRRLSRYDGSNAVQICALGALGRLGDADAVARLSQLAGGGPLSQRIQAAEALGVAATGPAIETLIHALTSFHRDDRPNAAQSALLAVGSGARVALEEALPSGPPLRRALVAETLGLLGDPAATLSLERAALDTDPTVREAALTALEVLRGP